jgi:hypothetical protein
MKARFSMQAVDDEQLGIKKNMSRPAASEAHCSNGA